MCIFIDCLPYKKDKIYEFPDSEGDKEMDILMVNANKVGMNKNQINNVTRCYIKHLNAHVHC